MIDSSCLQNPNLELLYETLQDVNITTGYIKYLPAIIEKLCRPPASHTVYDVTTTAHELPRGPPKCSNCKNTRSLTDKLYVYMYIQCSACGTVAPRRVFLTLFVCIVRVTWGYYMEKIHALSVYYTEKLVTHCLCTTLGAWCNVSKPRNKSWNSASHCDQ